MINFFTTYGVEILLAVVTAGAIGLCKWFHSKMKYYQGLNNKENIEKMEETIDHKLAPVIDEIEQLREYIRKTEVREKASMDLIIASYRYRLIQLCKLYIKAGEITAEQFDQLTEFYRVYTGLGGNGAAEEFYHKATSLPMV